MASLVIQNAYNQYGNMALLPSVKAIPTRNRWVGYQVIHYHLVPLSLNLYIPLLFLVGG